MQRVCERKVSRRSAGTPIISAMMRPGRGSAKARTISHSVRPSSASSSSRATPANAALHFSDATKSEGPGHQRPQAIVARRIHEVQHREQRLGLLDALGRECLERECRVPDVLEARDRPDPALGVVIERRLLAQAAVDRVGVLLMLGEIGVVEEIRIAALISIDPPDRRSSHSAQLAALRLESGRRRQQRPQIREHEPQIEKPRRIDLSHRPAGVDEKNLRARVAARRAHSCRPGSTRHPARNPPARGEALPRPSPSRSASAPAAPFAREAPPSAPAGPARDRSSPSRARPGPRAPRPGRAPDRDREAAPSRAGTPRRTAGRRTRRARAPHARARAGSRADPRNPAGDAKRSARSPAARSFPARAARSGRSGRAHATRGCRARSARTQAT